MEKIFKSSIKRLLIEKYNIPKSDYDIVDKVVEEIFDLNKKIVIPLTEMETVIFRKRYGIYTNGEIVHYEFISKEFNLNENKIEKIVNTCFAKLSFRIKKMEKRIAIPKMSSFDIKGGTDLAISELNLGKTTINNLLNAEIYTLRELLEFSKIELKYILPKKSLNEVVEYVHSLGYLFVDELAIWDQKKIIKNSSIEQVDNSSIYFVNCLKNIDLNTIRIYNVSNIEKLNSAINFFPREVKHRILQDMMIEGIQVKKVFDYTFEELYNSSIIILRTKKNTYDVLRKHGINKIIDLISHSKDELQIMLQNEAEVLKIINNVHALGLNFKDDAVMMKFYTESIEEDLKKSR